MQSIEISITSDHLQSISKTKPINAVEELVWNSLDAESSEVEVILNSNPLGGIEEVVVKDNGHGFSYEEALDEFKKLGDSWKRNSMRSKGEKRILHGRNGKGRFKAFSIGTDIAWKSIYRDDGKRYSIRILGKFNSTKFKITEPEITEEPVGTIVTINNLAEKIEDSLVEDSASEELSNRLALYLKQYPGINIIYNNQKLNPLSAQKDIYETSFFFSPKESKDNSYEVFLTIIEWNVKTKHALYLCDENDFALQELKSGVQAKGFNFTAYVKAPELIKYEDMDDLNISELNPLIKKLIDETREEIKTYFREKTSEIPAELIQSWKENKVYPFEGEPNTPVERTERQVFDICALNINDYLPAFADSDSINKKVIFQLLKNAIETGPRHIKKIIFELLDLPAAKQEELANLLERTTFDAIVTATKTVTDRMNFLRGLEVILFDEEFKDKLLERKQLHRIIADQTWIFGEEYHLTNDDENLREVLVKHQEKLGNDIEVLDPVIREDGREGIVDLVLSRTVPMANPELHKNLVIELKRPKVTIDMDALNQIDSYATAIINDERFDKERTEWVFIAISNKISDSVKPKTRQRGNPKGLVYDYSTDYKTTIWVKEWSEIINESKSRLDFFQKKLNCSIDKESALEYFSETYRKYLPKTE